MFFSQKKSAVLTAIAPIIPPVTVPVVPHGEPDMSGLGRALWQQKSRIIGLTLIAATGALVVVNAIPPRFRSEARILLEAKENIFLRAEADRNGERSALDPEAVTSQIQLVLSRDLAREVIKKEKLADKPEFDPMVNGVSIMRTVLGLFGLARDPASMSPEERTIESYYDHLSAFTVEKSRVIAISFYSSTPELAAHVANSISETYLGMQQTNKQEQTRAASQWLSGEITKMRTKVAEAEAKIQEYRAQTNLFVGSNNTSLPSQQLSEINSQISAARGQKADLEARARQLREMLRSGTSIDSSDIANSDSIRRLSEQRVALRAQIAEQSSTLLDQHPRIKELRAQIGELDRQIRTEGERLARQLDSDAKVAGSRLETLTVSLDQVKKIASQTNEQDVYLRELERESKAQRDLLESYLAKYREASARENINAAPPEARIISRASPANKPDFPKKVPMILIAAAAAFFLSAGFVITGELLAPASSSASYAYASYAPQAVAMPAYTPQVPTAYSRAAPFMPQTLQAAASAMRAPPMHQSASVTAVPVAPPIPVEQIAGQLRRAGEAGRKVSVIGIAREAGTTYAAISLARALAESASVVLVDLAFGAPNLSVISTDPQAPGIAELLHGAATFSDVITSDQYSQVHLIATGNAGADGPALLGTAELAGVIEALARSYDFLVIDGGAATETPVEYLAGLSTQAVVVTGNASGADVNAIRSRLAAAGMDGVSVTGGSAQAAAA